MGISRTAISANGNSAQIRITGDITLWWNSSDEIQSKVDELASQGYTTADVYIRTYGGSTMEAGEISNLILSNFPEGKVTIGAYCASAGNYISTKLKSKYKVSCYGNSQHMFHRPVLKTEGNINEIESDLKLLKIVEEDYAKTYAENTNLTEDQIRDYWLKGDYWMNAQEAKEKGFIDEILDSEDSIESKDIEAMKKYGYNIAAFAVQPKPTPTPNKTNIDTDTAMKLEALVLACGLDGNATQEQIIAQYNENKGYKEKYEALKKQKEVEARKATEDSLKALTTPAVTEKKITEEYAKTLVSSAMNMETGGKEFIEATLANFQAVPSVSAGIQTPAPGTSAQLDKDEEWENYSREELESMETENVDKFKALFKKEYGIDYDPNTAAFTF